MRVWFDTEFIEDGKTIDLVSIGMVREDGRLYYAESAEADLSKACPWVKENVLPHLKGYATPRKKIAQEIIDFVGIDPEFWAWFAAYDWVALCQLYGRMVELPEHWPMRCNDVAQLAEGYRIIAPKPAAEHDALEDAMWTRSAWLEVMKRAA